MMEKCLYIFPISSFCLTSFPVTLKVTHQVVQVFTIQPPQFVHGFHSMEVGFRRFLEDKYEGDYKDGKYHGQGIHLV